LKIPEPFENKKEDKMKEEKRKEEGKKSRKDATI
jgi:hypothetical protein